MTKDDRKALTTVQERILGCIADSQERLGYAPTIREIGDAVGLSSSSSVSHQLAQLEKHGYLRRNSNQARTIELLVDVATSDSPTEAVAQRRDAAFIPAPASRSPHRASSFP